jgi:glycosyltransferase involved in cell wall biosynthesis
MPRCSIIIPTFNSAKTLDRTLHSIVNQIFKDYEVLIVDGLSTDETLQIGARYSGTDSRIRVISGKDSGIYDAMNKGIDAARGEWLFFIGSDDIFHDPFVLEKVFTQRIPPDNKVMYGNARILGDTAWAVDGTVYDGKFDTRKLLNKNICHQAIFYETAFVKASIGYYNLKYRLCSDWDFNLRCWAKTQYHYLDLIITDFFAGGESTTNNKDDLFTKEYTPNVLSYFNISPFDKLVNNKQYQQFYNLLSIQKQQSPFRYWINRIQKGIF